MIHCPLRRRHEHKCHQQTLTVSHGSGASFSVFACVPWLLTHCFDDEKPFGFYGYRYLRVRYDVRRHGVPGTCGHATLLEMTDTTCELKSLGRPPVFGGRDDEWSEWSFKIPRVTIWPVSSKKWITYSSVHDRDIGTSPSWNHNVCTTNILPARHYVHRSRARNRESS